MREVEIKAHVIDMEETAAMIERYLGKGRKVLKEDFYFRLPGETVQSFRIRKTGGRIIFTAKKNSKKNGTEDNLEYEFESDAEYIERSKEFFRTLGYEDYFVKRKEGFEWFYENAHIELLEVNDLGSFIEIEILLPPDSSSDERNEAENKIRNILKMFSVSDECIEDRTYRDMILRTV